MLQVKTVFATIFILLIAVSIWPLTVIGHPAQQGFVLLLPTDFYISAGITTVVLTVIILGILPAKWSINLFSTKKFTCHPLPKWTADVTSLCSFAILTTLLWIGFTGSGDPLSNLLPLIIWTFWWTLLLFLQGIIGDCWKWLNPWTGIYKLIIGQNRSGILQLPKWLGSSIGVFGLILFSSFALADLAPDNPPRLAVFVLVYWIVTFIGMCIFGGDKWLAKVECFTMLFELFAKIAPVSTKSCHGQIGIPGWKIVAFTSPTLAIFALTALAVGSFDGLNETFWWLNLIGINPLEFPGRSTVGLETVSGMLASILLLHTVFAFCVWLGHRLALSNQLSELVSYQSAFCRFALSILPIALGYHFAHYLPSFLVNSQYLIAALNDPLTSNADLFGLGVIYVTTGFFNTQETVRIILLTQCVAIVLGHVIAVLIAHAIAINLYKSSRKAIMSQIPMAVFMALYTFLSLWLLASPRGT